MLNNIVKNENQKFNEGGADMSGEKKDREWKNENLMEAFHRFRKLNFSGLFPELKNFEFATMATARPFNTSYSFIW